MKLRGWRDKRRRGGKVSVLTAVVDDGNSGIAAKEVDIGVIVAQF